MVEISLPEQSYCHFNANGFLRINNYTCSSDIQAENLPIEVDSASLIGCY